VSNHVIPLGITLRSIHFLPTDRTGLLRDLFDTQLHQHLSRQGFVATIYSAPVHPLHPTSITTVRFHYCFDHCSLVALYRLVVGRDSVFCIRMVIYEDYNIGGSRDCTNLFIGIESTPSTWLSGLSIVWLLPLSLKNCLLPPKCLDSDTERSWRCRSSSYRIPGSSALRPLYIDPPVSALPTLLYPSVHLLIAFSQRPGKTVTTVA
jgi:hypothetical protein